MAQDRTRSDPHDNTSTADTLRGILAEKLEAAAREILAVFDRIVSAYEEEASGFRREIERQRRQIERQRRQLEALQPRVELVRCDELELPPPLEPVKEKEEEEEEGGGELKEEEEQHPLSEEDSASLTPLCRPEEEEVEEEDEGEEVEEEDVEEEEKEEEEERPQVRPTQNTRQDQEKLKDLDHDESRSTLTFRFRILENLKCAARAQVCQKIPTQTLTCPRGLQQEDFLELLRSTFPELAGNQRFDLYVSTRKYKKIYLQKIKTFTPEELLKLAGRLCLYILLQYEISKPQKRGRRSSANRKRTKLTFKFRVVQTAVVTPQVCQNIPLQTLTCPRGLQHEDFLELLRSTFPQLAGNQPFDLCVSTTRKRLRSLKIESFTSEEIHELAGPMTLYILLQNQISNNPEVRWPSSSSMQMKRRDAAHPDARQIPNDSSHSDTCCDLNEDDTADDLANISPSRQGKMDAAGTHDEETTANIEAAQPATESKRDADDDDDDDDDDDVEDVMIDGGNRVELEENLEENLPESHSSKKRKQQVKGCEVEAKRRKLMESPLEKHGALLACKVCWVPHASKSSLLDHTWSHMNDLESLCGLCGERFNSRENLRSHLHCHSTAHDCPECGMAFFSVASLRVHAAVHTVKRYQCDFCPKAYCQMVSLIKHLTVHGIFKWHRCNFCPLLFRHKEDLSAHSRTHSAESRRLRGVRALASHKSHRSVEAGEKINTENI